MLLPGDRLEVNIGAEAEREDWLLDDMLMRKERSVTK